MTTAGDCFVRGQSGTALTSLKKAAVSDRSQRSLLTALEASLVVLVAAGHPLLGCVH